MHHSCVCPPVSGFGSERVCVVTVASDGGLIQGLVHCLGWRLEAGG